jgi:hypothetical protein
MTKKLIDSEVVSMHEVSGAPTSLWQVNTQEDSQESHDDLISELNTDLVDDGMSVGANGGMASNSKNLAVATASLDLF